MLQAANTDLFNPFVPKAHSSKSQFKVKLKDFYFCTLGTSGLIITWRTTDVAIELS